MGEMMECMCLQCGISNHLDVEGLVFDRDPESDLVLIRHPFCTQCGGTLALIGRAGDEPRYRVEPGRAVTHK